MSRKRFQRRTLVLLLVLILSAGLLLDLQYRGVAWRAFYHLTGEESPPAQIVGMLQWSGRWFRQLPRTTPYEPVNHADMPPFGANVFLEQEVEIAKREQILQMLSEAGFVWLRQEFPWEDIEIHARGDFSDRRNDTNQDGVLNDDDAISAWDKYDNIVSLVEQYDMQLMVRLSNPPSWTHTLNPEIGSQAPPDDLQDFVNFAVTVAERYQGRILHYQIWNEPNIYPEWGNQNVDPVAYTDMLCRTYDALKAVDPNIVVISGALAPTNSMDYRNLNDFIYLQRMFDVGAGRCFDVLAMQGYGLNSGPTDRRMRPQTVNFARPLYIRDMLVANGYANKPIWISEAAWNPVPSEAEVPDISGRYTFGQVSEEQAARYMVEAYDRFQREWNWGGVMFYWFFKRPADYERNQSFYYFRMVEPDFTPLPVYHALKDYITTLTPTLYRGTHQESHWALTLPNEAQRVPAEAAQFGHATRTPSAAFIAYGTEVAVRWQGGGAVGVYRDDTLLYTLPSNANAAYTKDGWHELRVRLSWIAEPHNIRIEADDDTLLLDAIIIYDNTVRDIGVLVGITLFVIAFPVLGLYLQRQQERRLAAA